MPEDTNNSDNQNNEIVMDQFLLDTLVSLQTTLSSLDKDSAEKTEMIATISDNLHAIAFAMKEIREKQAKQDIYTHEIIQTLGLLGSKLDILTSKVESEVNTHIKETKYAIQSLKDYFHEIRLENKVAAIENKKSEKKKKQEGDGEEGKKFELSSFFSNLWEAIKNIKTILMIILALSLVITGIITGGSVLGSVLEAIKHIFS
jgi:ABC-type antimicrobial peptide transport system permease subunit